MTSSGRTSQRVAGEEERRSAIVVTGQAILPESAPTLMRVTEGAEEAEGAGRVSQCAIAATGLVTLRGSAQRVMVAETLEGQFATDVTGLATLPGSALRVMVDVMLDAVAMEEVDVVIWDEVAAVDMEIQGVSEVDVILAAEVVDPSATSATGLVTLPESAGRKRTAATSATALGTLRGTAARMRTPATTAMRWVTL